jgi:hypothetical protein
MAAVDRIPELEETLDHLLESLPWRTRNGCGTAIEAIQCVNDLMDLIDRLKGVRKPSPDPVGPRRKLQVNVDADA